MCVDSCRTAPDTVSATLIMLVRTMDNSRKSGHSFLSASIMRCVISVVMVCIGTLAYGQTASRIAAMYRAAIGNAGTLEQLHSWSIVGKMSSADGSWKRSFRAWFDGQKARTELMLQPGIVATSWSDGKEGWSIQPWTRSLTPQPLNAASLRRLVILAELWHNDLLKSTAPLEYLGSEELDGSDCYKVRARRADGSVWTYWVDPDVGLLVKVSVEESIVGETLRWEATFGNYARVGDVLMPMVLDTSSGLIIVEQYQLNPTLDPTLFASPTK